MEWSTEIRKKLQEKAQECKILADAHESEAYMCNTRNRIMVAWNRILVLVVTIMQILVTSLKKKDNYISTSLIVLLIIHLVITELISHCEYSTHEKEHIKTSADYQLLYSNIILALSEEHSLELPKESYTRYIFNTFNRIKNNSPYLRDKVRSAVKIKPLESIDITIINKPERSTSLKIDEEIKNRLDNNSINSIQEWEAYRLIYNI